MNADNGRGREEIAVVGLSWAGEHCRSSEEGTIIIIIIEGRRRRRRRTSDHEQPDSEMQGEKCAKGSRGRLVKLGDR